MDTRTYLMQISKLNRKIKKDMAEIEEYKTLMYGLSAVKLEERVQTSPDFDKMGAAIAKLETLTEGLNQEIDYYVAKKNVIKKQIESFIDDDEMAYEVLWAKYIQFHTFEKIAVDQNYSYRQIRRIHTKAINSFYQKYGNLYANK